MLGRFYKINANATLIRRLQILQDFILLLSLAIGVNYTKTSLILKYICSYIFLIESLYYLYLRLKRFFYKRNISIRDIVVVRAKPNKYKECDDIPVKHGCTRI